MSSNREEPKAPPIRLLPHQAALVEAALSPTNKRVILLRGDVGLGKTTALAAIASRLIQERPTARALLLAPAALRLHFAEMLRAAGVPGMLVDRYRFREMLDSTTGEEVWPGGMVAVLSLDFAKQADVCESLAATRWDLLIADETHSIRGARAEALRRVGAFAGRVVLATLPDLETPDVFPPEDTMVVEWRRDQVVDHDGAPLETVPRPIWQEVRFRLNPAELSLRASIGDLCEHLGGAKGTESWKAMTLLRSFASSPAALEGALQGLVTRLTAEDSEDGIEQPMEPLDEEVLEYGLTGRMDRPTAEKVAGIARRVLQEVEAIASDSKLSAFGELLSHLNEGKTPFRRICVLTDYLATLYYLAAEIEGRGKGCQLLHGGMAAEDRHRALTLFANEGEILVATRAVATAGIDLREVTDLVCYDVPKSNVALRQVLGRFDRIGRRSQLKLYVLTASNSPDGPIAESIALLGDLLAGPARQEPSE